MIDDSDLNQFEDAPEEINQDSRNPEINNEAYSNESYDDIDEEDYDSDFGENDDGIPESKGPNCQVIIFFVNIN